MTLRSVDSDEFRRELSQLEGLGNPEALQNEEGRSTSGEMELVDAKIAASEARTDVKFAKLEGKLDLILEKVETVKAQSADARGEARATRRTVVGTGISLGALLIAIFALYVNSFTLGARVDEIARTEAEQIANQIAAPTASSQVALPAPANEQAPTKQ